MRSNQSPHAPQPVPIETRQPTYQILRWVAELLDELRDKTKHTPRYVLDRMATAAAECRVRSTMIEHVGELVQDELHRKAVREQLRARLEAEKAGKAVG